MRWGRTRHSRRRAQRRQPRSANGRNAGRLAQKTKLTEEQATQNVVTGYLVGGIIGVVVASSDNEEANKHPKSAFRRQVHDDCMAKRGYQKAE